MQINIKPIFASPIVTVVHPDSSNLNAALKQLINEKVENNQTNSTPAPTLRVNIFDSEMDLFEWPDECVQTLKSFTFNVLKNIVCKLNNYSPSVLDKYSIRNDAWFHVTSDSGYISSHVHSMASWSGVYYIDDGQPDSDRPDNGVIRFLDTRPGANMFLDKGNFNIQQPFNSGSFNIVPMPGLLVLFPSYLAHEVTPFFGKGKRVCIAFNSWFVDKETGDNIVGGK